MPKFKITEFRTTPYIFEVEAEDENHAKEVFDSGEYKVLGHDDSTDVWVDIEEISEDETIEVEYPIEENP